MQRYRLVRWLPRNAEPRLNSGGVAMSGRGAEQTATKDPHNAEGDVGLAERRSAGGGIMACAGDSLHWVKLASWRTGGEMFL